MSDYGWYGKTNYEPDDKPLDDDPTPYSKALSGCFWKGALAIPSEKCPYKRSDFVNAWGNGYEYYRNHDNDVEPVIADDWWKDIPV